MCYLCHLGAIVGNWFDKAADANSLVRKLKSRSLHFAVISCPCQCGPKTLSALSQESGLAQILFPLSPALENPSSREQHNFHWQQKQQRLQSQQRDQIWRNFATLAIILKSFAIFGVLVSYLAKFWIHVGHFYGIWANVQRCKLAHIE